MGEQTACRHNRLYYAPSGHKDGSCSESWYCDSCGEHFNIREPAILRARVAELERRNAAMVDWIYRAGFEYASTSKAFHGMSPSIGGAMDVLSESDIESARLRAEGRKQ